MAGEDWYLESAVSQHFGFVDLERALDEETTSIAERREAMQRFRGIQAWLKALFQAIGEESPWGRDRPFLGFAIGHGDWPTGERLRSILQKAEEAKRDW